MGDDYRVVCLECREEFPVGKLLVEALPNGDCRQRFGGTGTDPTNPNFHKLWGDELRKFVEAFLILHVGHELAFIADCAMDAIDFDARRVEDDEIEKRLIEMSNRHQEGAVDFSVISPSLAHRIEEIRDSAGGQQSN